MCGHKYNLSSLEIERGKERTRQRICNVHFILCVDIPVNTIFSVGERERERERDFNLTMFMMSEGWFCNF